MNNAGPYRTAAPAPEQETEPKPRRLSSNGDPFIQFIKMQKDRERQAMKNRIALFNVQHIMNSILDQLIFAISERSKCDTNDLLLKEYDIRIKALALTLSQLAEVGIVNP